MHNSIVVLTRCSDYSSDAVTNAIAKQLKLLGGLERFIRPGDVVLLKPNFIAPRCSRHATQTHPAIILEIARLLKDYGAKPFLGDSPAWGDVFACVKALNLEEPLKKMSIPVRQLNKPKRCRIGAGNIKVGISSVALDADVIINLPKFKSHQQLVATFAVKNMFGCVSGKRKALWHFRKGKNFDDFCELLIDIYNFLSPAFTIIDGVMAMDGRGPIRGRTRPLGWLIGGTDPIACEIVCSKLVNIEPENVPIIKTARQIGSDFPNAERIEILGDGFPQNVYMDFELPEMTPLRFSLVHVCKSIAKQILLLAELPIKTFWPKRF